MSIVVRTRSKTEAGTHSGFYLVPSAKDATITAYCYDKKMNKDSYCFFFETILHLMLAGF